MLAKKDSVGLWTKKRMCEDYRPLNLVTPQDPYGTSYCSFLGYAKFPTNEGIG
jgi:hypothetical protein